MADEIDVQKGWTLAAYVAHNEAMREMQERVSTERDRRYAELAVEREKALAIKEKADDRALHLAREIQTYKDEKANELRSQIERERGSYATQSDLRASVEKLEETIKPLGHFVSTQQGRHGGVVDARTLLLSLVGLLIAGSALALAFIR